jgi:8-oxo-dGTP diphosphatase
VRKQVRTARVILETPEGVLLLRRAPGASFAGQWELPGGKLDGGECPRTALCRELSEETGIHLAADALLPVGRLEHSDERRVISTDVFRARVASRAPLLSDEHDAHGYAGGPLAGPLGAIADAALALAA